MNRHFFSSFVFVALLAVSAFALAGEVTTLRVPDFAVETAGGALVSVAPTKDVKKAVQLVQARQPLSLLVGDATVQDIVADGETTLRGKTKEGKTFILVGAD